ncbi:hypothetical protein BGZ98_009633 [Dissophora globulifera]|nr:hypothetical protein BGZ98_009633 [Dissophora globulifera]
MQASVPTTTSTPSKTITPRIVPIVEIPKYTTINPPKTEIVDDNVDSDNDWAPDPPPRDSPKKIDTKVTAKLLASTGPPTPPKVDIQQQKPVSVASSFKSSPTSASHPTTPVLTENAMPAEDDRVPLPPPREFRRQSVGLQTLTGAGAGAVEAAATTSPGSSVTSLTRPGSSSIFRVTQTSSPSSTQTTTAGSSFKNTSVPAPGTVRTNSAKFNALAASASGKDAPLPSPKSISPKSANSVLSSTNIAGSTTSSPWTARKSVENTRRNSLPKGSALAATLGSVPTKERKSLDGSSATTGSPRQESVVIPPETYADKELPPIRPDTPPSSQPAIITAVAAEMTATPLRGHYFNAQPVSDEGKCIVTEEDKLAGVPVADDASKEAVIVEEEDEKKDVSPSPSGVKKTPSPVKAARRKSSGAGADKQASSAFICSSCEEPISGMMITAMGKRWHSDHFVCTVCDLNLEHVQFFQKDGLPYCHFDYHDKFSPKCGHCDSAIENECLTALGKNWHPGHFFCRECGDPFGEDGYMVHDDFPYCEKDYLRLFAPKCTGCLDPIQGDFISALKGKWHRDCFGCTVCHIGFDTASYYVENGKPYCQTHYKTGAQPAVA